MFRWADQIYESRWRTGEEIECRQEPLSCLGVQFLMLARAVNRMKEGTP